ncbi:MAG: ATP-grasp domain-containing protein [archaeon]|nr:ATP-grasp domain-containing protein [archaeon]
MRHIVIVDCDSTGRNFIDDIVRKNYNPVVLESKLLSDLLGFDEENRSSKEDYNFDEDFVLIHEEDDYEDTLNKVKEFDPILVLPGSEGGVTLATNLANDLGLPSNPTESLPAMTLKDEMHKALAKANLRYIKGEVIKSVDEAIKFYDENNLKSVVVKPLRSMASANVKICLSRDEMISAVSEFLGNNGQLCGSIDELLIQEYIQGEEYIVNTVTCNGKHRVTLVWKYNKVMTSDGAIIYDYCETVNELGLGHAEMIEYAYQVADAIGITHGPVHGEYMIDENGPVLIEVNCRPCGGTMPAEFLDRISGQHETDSILDSYLNPKRFEELRKRRYRLYAHGVLKFFIVPDNVLAESSPMEHISNNLKSHYKTKLDVIGESKFFEKTKDLYTSFGTIFLVHEDGYYVHQDLEYLRSVEREAFSQVLSDGSNKQLVKVGSELPEDIKNVLSAFEIYGNSLFVTDSIIEDISSLQIPADQLDQVPDNFDSVFVNLDDSVINKKDNDIALLFFNIINKVNRGGLIFIPEKTYQYVASGRKGVEAFIKALGLRIELPPCELKNVIIASKTS